VNQRPPDVDDQKPGQPQDDQNDDQRPEHKDLLHPTTKAESPPARSMGLTELLCNGLDQILRSPPARKARRVQDRRPPGLHVLDGSTRSSAKLLSPMWTQFKVIGATRRVHGSALAERKERRALCAGIPLTGAHGVASGGFVPQGSRSLQFQQRASAVCHLSPYFT
jgi:hypothetical protein